MMMKTNTDSNAYRRAQDVVPGGIQGLQPFGGSSGAWRRAHTAHVC